MRDENIILPQEPTPKKKKKKAWKKVLLIIVIVFLSLLLIAVAAVGFYMNHLLDRITPYDPSNDATISYEDAEQLLQDDPELEEVAPDDTEDLPNLEDLTIPDHPVLDLPETTQPQTPQITEPPLPPVNWDNVVNIMLVGQDRLPGQGRQRSDAMILVTFNKTKNTITLTSFMRDQYVKIPGYKNNKMNAAYAYGGMSLLNKTMETNFSVHVDGDVEVDFNNFQKLIDMLGGVDIKLTSKEAKYLNETYVWYGSKWEVKSGMNRLDGEQALAYSRIRKIDSDYRRAERQRKVISSLIQRYKSLPVSEMLSLLEDVLPLVTTNMSKSEIVGYAMELAPMLAGAEIDTMRIPLDGTFRQGRVRVRAGLAAWFQYDIDFSANRKALRELFED
jgi:LCP family protein required for cell wall assembly